MIPSLPTPPEWMRRALCAEFPAADVFHPWPSDARGVQVAKAICADCPVQFQCLRWALEHDERDGIWGGTTPDERAKLTARKETTSK